MKTAVLVRIERTNLVLGVVATSVAGLLWGGRGMVSVFVVSILMVGSSAVASGDEAEV
jgi:hypothetical protein